MNITRIYNVLGRMKSRFFQPKLSKNEFWKKYRISTGQNALIFANLVEMNYNSQALEDLIMSVSDAMYRLDIPNSDQNKLEEHIPIEHMEKKDRSLRPSNIRLLSAATLAANPRNILHVGGFWGRTTICSILALAMKQKISDTEAQGKTGFRDFDIQSMGQFLEGIHLDVIEINPDWYQIIQLNIKQFGLEKVVSAHLGNSLEVIPSLLKANMKYDFVFLDGDHHYETVMNEFKLLKNFSNIIAFDDLNQVDGPGKAWKEISKAFPNIEYNSHLVTIQDGNAFLKNTSHSWSNYVLDENQKRLVANSGIGSKIGVAIIDQNHFS